MTRIYGLIALILVTVLAVMLIFGMSVVSKIKDTTDNTDSTILSQGIPLNTLIQHHIVSALDRAEEGRLTLHLDDFDINELLYAISQEINSSSLDVRSIYIEKTTDAKHRICAPITLMGVDSLISGDIDLYESDGAVYAEVKGLRVGRIGIDSSLASLLKVKGRIVRALEDSGISSSFTGDSLTVRLSREDVASLISTHLAESPNLGLVNAMYSLLVMRGNAVDIEIASPTDISVGIDMTLFDGRVSNLLDGLNPYTENLLRDGIITRDDVSLCAKYYVNGYDRLSDEEKTEATDLLCVQSSPEGVSAHGGIIEREKVSLLNILLTQLELNTDYLVPGFKIADSDISAMLSDLPLVGTVWQYSSYRDLSCAYAALESFYCLLDDELISIYIDLNLNGYTVTLRADFFSGESPVTAIGGRLTSARLGNIILNEYEVNQLFGFLSAKLEYDWIYTDPEAQTLTIDFTETFKDSGLLIRLIKNSKHIVTVCKGRLLSDGGYVQITITLFD